MSPADLKRFCADPDIEFMRSYLWGPWSSGGYSFATDGHIMVRVPQIEGVEDYRTDELGVAEAGITKVWAGYEQAAFFPVSAELPPASDADEECSKCDGRGTAHDCPECFCVCRQCDGTGHTNLDRGRCASIDGVPFALRYFRLLVSLPELRLAKPLNAERPLAFRFEGGGEGRLMPMRGKYPDAISVQFVESAP